MHVNIFCDLARYLLGCFQADMNSKKIIHCLAKITLPLTLIGSRIKFMVVLSSG